MQTAVSGRVVLVPVKAFALADNFYFLENRMSNKKIKNSSGKKAKGLKFSRFQVFVFGFIFIFTLSLIAVNFIFGEEKFTVSMPLVVLDAFLAVIVILPSIRHLSITKGDVSIGASLTAEMNEEEIESDEKEGEMLQGVKLTKENMKKIQQQLVNIGYLDKNALPNRKIESDKISNHSATFNFYSEEKKTFVKIITAKTFSAQLHDSLFFRINRFLDFKEGVPEAKLIVVLARDDNEGDSLKKEIERDFFFSEKDSGLSCILLQLGDI